MNSTKLMPRLRLVVCSHAGVIIVVIVVLATCWIRFRIRLRDSWVQPTMMLILPIVFFIVLAIITAAVEGIARALGVVLAVVVVGLSTSCIAVAAVPLAQCTWIANINIWLTVQGIATFGSFFGVVVWRYSGPCGKIINGPKVLLGVLLFISVAWLVLGNVAVGIVYGACNVNNFGTIFYQEPIDCSTFVLPFTLAVVVIFDAIYIILGVVLCLNFGNCCSKETNKKVTIHTNWVWKTLVGFAVGYSLLGVLSIGVGASYLLPCYHVEWVPIRLITHGVIIVVTVTVMTWWMCCKQNLRESSFQPTTMLIPQIFFLLITTISSAIGLFWLLQERSQSCAGLPPCDHTLQVLAAVILILNVIPNLFAIYMGAVFFVVFIIFLLITASHYFSKDESAVEPVSCENTL